MFQGSGKKEFHCRRCMLKDARRRFLNGENFVRVEFREIKFNSRSPSPHGYNNSLHKACIQQENRGSILEDTSVEINYQCKRCLYHHQAYRKLEQLVEYPIEKPAIFEREEYRTRGNTPRKARRASPTGIWTRDVLRECANCLHHHGFDTTKCKCVVKPDHARHQLGSSGNLQTRQILQKDNGGELSIEANDIAWWENSEEEYGCGRCSSHHMQYEGLLKRILKDNHILRVYQVGKRSAGGLQPMAPGDSSPEFATPTNEFSRSRTPTPQRSYNYRELYERKIQARRFLNKNNFELCQLWKPSKKTPTHDIAEYVLQCRGPVKEREDGNNKAGSPIARNIHEVKARKKASHGIFSQPHECKGNNNARPSMKNVRSIDKSLYKSPKWSKECLHKRELTKQSAIDMTGTTKNGYGKNRLNYGKLMIGRYQSPTLGQGRGLTRRMLSPKFEMGNTRTKMVQGNQASKTPKFTRENKNIMRSRPGHEHERRAMMLEEKESRWAPPANWTTHVTIKEVKGKNVSLKKYFKVDEELPPSNIQHQKENLNLNTNLKFSHESRTTDPLIKSPKLSSSGMQLNESRSKRKKRETCSPHEKKTNVDYKFEVTHIDTKDFEERNPNSYTPDLLRTQNSSPSPKQIFLRIPKCGSRNNSDKDQKASRYMPNLETRETSAMSKEKCDRDMRLRVEIQSELPLDVVDGRLKKFLRGMGGLIYYSPKDGGIPRIKELANYFSGKQPLLWFFPRST